MLRGLLYDASSEELTQERLAAKELCFAYNRTPPSDETRQRELMRRLLSAVGGRFTILAPFWCDYGCNTFMGPTILLVNLGSMLTLRFRSR